MHAYLIFISMALLAAEPVTPDELKLAVALLEERLTDRSTIEVEFHTKLEKSITYTRQSSPQTSGYSYRWIRKGDRQTFERKSNGPIPLLLRKWIYDGKSFQDLIFGPKGDLKEVWIRHGAQQSNLVKMNMLAQSLGFVHTSHIDGLLPYLKLAQRNKTLTAIRTTAGVNISLGTHDDHQTKWRVSLTVDSEHDYRLQSWRNIEINKDGSDGNVWLWAIDEFQAVSDGTSGAMIWFPLRAHHQNRAIIQRIDVKSVRINQEVADSVFSHIKVPIGIPVREEAKVIGDAPRDLVVGTKQSHDQRLDLIQQQVTDELDRLSRDGTIHDASIPADWSAVYWGCLGCVLLLAALCFAWVFRRPN